MKFMLVILITLGASGDKPKIIEMRIPQENQEECLKAAKKIDFSFKFPGKEIKTKSECIPKDSKVDDDNIET